MPWRTDQRPKHGAGRFDRRREIGSGKRQKPLIPSPKKNVSVDDVVEHVKSRMPETLPESPIYRPFVTVEDIASALSCRKSVVGQAFLKLNREGILEHGTNVLPHDCSRGRVPGAWSGWLATRYYFRKSKDVFKEK